jgi:hypothetical protein
VFAVFAFRLKKIVTLFPNAKRMRFNSRKIFNIADGKDLHVSPTNLPFVDFSKNFAYIGSRNFY